MAYEWDGYFNEGEDFDAYDYAAEVDDGPVDEDGDHQFACYQVFYPFPKPNAIRIWKPGNTGKPPVVPGKRRKVRKLKPVQSGA